VCFVGCLPVVELVVLSVFDNQENSGFGCGLVGSSKGTSGSILSCWASNELLFHAKILIVIEESKITMITIAVILETALDVPLKII